jgi:hypothetical protein
VSPVSKIPNTIGAMKKLDPYKEITKAETETEKLFWERRIRKSMFRDNFSTAPRALDEENSFYFRTGFQDQIATIFTG